MTKHVIRTVTNASTSYSAAIPNYNQVSHVIIKAIMKSVLEESHRVASV